VTKADPEFRSALARALSMVDEIGKGGSTKPHLGQRTALVELMVLQVRSGDLRPPLFLQHPAHLPEGNELKLLIVGAASKDAQLRQDAFEWRDVNRAQADVAAASLRNAIESTRIADELLNDPDADEKLHEWKREIDAYVRATFAVDTSAAPYDRTELDLWCREMCSRANPVPEWLRDWRSGMTFTVQTPERTVRSEMRHHAGDDDE
jgi:hypothetical protein